MISVYPTSSKDIFGADKQVHVHHKLISSKKKKKVKGLTIAEKVKD